MKYTEEEAKQKFCPFNSKHCKGKACMLFEHAKNKKYYCGLISKQSKRKIKCT